MAEPIRMPALGQVSDELTILTWLKEEGEVVALGEALFEVETDKATLEVEAAAGGTLLRRLGAEGGTYEVGTVLAWVGEPGDSVPDAAPAEEVTAATDRPPNPAPRAAAAAGKVMASPAVRRLAQELSVDLAAVSGTGPGGRIERRDVEARAE